MGYAVTVEGRLSGKKTYLVAALLTISVLVLVFLGKMTPAAAMSVGLMAAAAFGVTFRSAIEQHHQELMVMLLEVADAGKEVAAHNLAAAEPDAVKLIGQAQTLAAEVKGEANGV